MNEERLVKKATKTVYPKTEFTYNGSQYRIDRVSVSPLSSAIDISVLSGRTISNCIVIDDKGRTITVNSVSGTGNNKGLVQEQRLKFSGYDLLPNKIIIIPQDRVETYDLKDGITIDLNK